MKLVVVPKKKDDYNENLLSKAKITNNLWKPTREILIESNDKIMNNSWFSCTKQSKINNQNLQIIPPTIQTTEVQLRVKTIRLKLSGILEKKVKEAIFVTRALYNKCVELCCRENPIPVNLKTLRNLLTCNKNKENIFSQKQKEDFEKVPSAIRDEALKDFVKAYEIQMNLLKEKKRTHFEMNFRRRKDKIQESIVIAYRKVKRNKNGDYYCFPKIWGKNEILDTYEEKLPDIINHDCRLIMKTVGNDEQFYLAIPTDVEIKPKVKHDNAVSLDPGVKIFQTTYDTEGNSYIIGENDINKLDQMSRIAQRMRDGKKRIWVDGKREFVEILDNREKKGLLKAAEKVEQKIKNKIADIHRKTAKFLCDNYDTVIIPNFQTKQMTEKKDENGKWKRKIGKETSRKMIRWGHYQFRQLLIAKGAATGTNIYEGTEEWTSKTCGNCFYINYNLKLQDREFECSKCNYSCHRDINAARNIMLLNFEKSGLKLFVPRKLTLKFV